jgi:hypothetical protein
MKIEVITFVTIAIVCFYDKMLHILGSGCWNLIEIARGLGPGMQRKAHPQNCLVHSHIKVLYVKTWSKLACPLNCMVHCMS